MVPLGFLIMCIYHLYLLYRYLTSPELTSIGYENHNKKAWVESILLVYNLKHALVFMTKFRIYSYFLTGLSDPKRNLTRLITGSSWIMQVEPKERGFAVAVLNGLLAGSTSLSSISLVLCSLIGALLGNSSNNLLTGHFIFGDSSQSTNSIKYIAILACFLLAFACFVQTTRHFIHASFLISMPTGDVPVPCIQKAVIRGSNFWAVGLRALYFATTLLLWIFGPIPMFVGSVSTVVILHFLDINKQPLIQYAPGKNTHGSHSLQKLAQKISGAFQHNGSPNERNIVSQTQTERLVTASNPVFTVSPNH